MFCQSCGMEVASSYKFCPKCGGKQFVPNLVQHIVDPLPPPVLPPVSGPSVQPTVNNINATNNNFFKRLAHGDFGLAKTYWLFGVAVGFVANLLSGISAASGTMELALAIVIIFTAYWLFVAVGIWRAASKYPGNKLWAVLARIAIVLGVVSQLFSITALGGAVLHREEAPELIPEPAPVAAAPEAAMSAFDRELQEAETGNPISMNNIGVAYHDGNGVAQDYSKAAEWFRKSAEADAPLAMFHLGVMYQEGNGFPKNYTEATKWYRKAANKGLPDGMNNLGVMYADGNGMDIDHFEAAKWFRKAADAGHAKAMLNLGSMYEHGLGVEMSGKNAIAWYKKSAALGDEDAKTALGRLGIN